MLGTSYGRGVDVPMLGTVGVGSTWGLLSPRLGTVAELATARPARRMR